jgi:hypothetical protein
MGTMRTVGAMGAMGTMRTVGTVRPMRSVRTVLPDSLSIRWTNVGACHHEIVRQIIRLLLRDFIFFLRKKGAGLLVDGR